MTDIIDIFGKLIVNYFVHYNHEVNMWTSLNAYTHVGSSEQSSGTHSGRTDCTGSRQQPQLGPCCSPWCCRLGGSRTATTEGCPPSWWRPQLNAGCSWLRWCRMERSPRRCAVVRWRSRVGAVRKHCWGYSGCSSPANTGEKMLSAGLWKLRTIISYHTCQRSSQDISSSHIALSFADNVM